MLVYQTEASKSPLMPSVCLSVGLRRRIQGLKYHYEVLDDSMHISGVTATFDNRSEENMQHAALPYIRSGKVAKSRVKHQSFPTKINLAAPFEVLNRPLPSNFATII
ncbi:hypothetical protein AVEN_14258-1 [Araneus ventricosus]|uniref:Uncharacterized protein n=1 Tax=Araneus ventricosus TaxID=182803 RepID=A0A4Y2TAR9_ARAVE|nr:hypothetical protein AVEN_14258-1 [Araneus ventricosus]